MEMGVQLVMNLTLSTLEFLVITTCRTWGKRWNIPVHIVREIRTCIKLPVIIFKASMLSEAKGIWVFLSMVLPEALQVLSSVGLVLFDLLSNNQETEQALAMANIRQIRSTQQVAQTCRKSYRGLKGVRQRLKDIAQSCKKISKKDLNQMTWTKEDVDLLNEVSSSLSSVVMLEVCEVVAPLIYIALLLCLQSSTFLGNNVSYFLGLANANFEQSLIANSYSLLLEAILLLVTEVCMRTLIGMSFCSFIGFVLRCDFSFWLSTLSMAYVGWLTMLVQHSGHDFKFQFSWLPWLAEFCWGQAAGLGGKDFKQMLHTLKNISMAGGCLMTIGAERVGGLLVDAINLQSSRDAAALWAYDLVMREDVTCGFRDLVVTALQMDPVVNEAQQLAVQVVNRVLQDESTILEAKRVLRDALADQELRNSAKDTLWNIVIPWSSQRSTDEVKRYLRAAEDLAASPFLTEEERNFLRSLQLRLKNDGAKRPSAEPSKKSSASTREEPAPAATTTTTGQEEEAPADPPPATSPPQATQSPPLKALKGPEEQKLLESAGGAVTPETPKDRGFQRNETRPDDQR
eukprot:s2052_g24.t1